MGGRPCAVAVGTFSKPYVWLPEREYIRELMTDGLMIDGLMIDGLMIDGLMIDGLVVTTARNALAAPLQIICVMSESHCTKVVDRTCIKVSVV